MNPMAAQRVPCGNCLEVTGPCKVSMDLLFSPGASQHFKPRTNIIDLNAKSFCKQHCYLFSLFHYFTLRA